MRPTTPRSSSLLPRWGTALAVLILAFPVATAARGEPLTRVRYLMGSACSITAHGDPERTRAGIEAAFASIAAIEAALSTYRDDSELAQVNRLAGDGPVPVSAEVGAFLRQALAFARRTGGAFDPTVGPLVAAWDLRGAGRRPSAEHLERARRSVGYRLVSWDAVAGTVTYDAPGMWLDPGAIGKGYALDRAAERLREAGIGVALLDFSGQLLALGAPRGEKGWTVAVADPADRERAAMVLTLRDASAATSAQSERGARVEDEWFGHILDPRVGVPVRRCGSVTVVASSATAADALATALFVMGPDEGLSWSGGEGELGVGYLLPVSGCAGDGAVRLRMNDRFRHLVVARREGVHAGREFAAGGTMGGRR